MTTNTTTLPLIPGVWAVDGAHSTVGFAVRHLGVAKVRGRFTGFDATVTVGETLADTSVVASIDLATVDTGNADRDAHVQADDIVDVAKRPSIDFRSTAISGSGDDWTLEGEATIGGITKPLTLNVELGGIGDFPGGGPRHAGFEATGELRRSDYGIAPGMPSAMLGDVIKIQLDLELLEPSR